MVGHVYRVNTGYRVDACYTISVQFVEIRREKHDHTSQTYTVNTEFETATSIVLAKLLRMLVFTTCQYRHEQNHVET